MIPDMPRFLPWRPFRSAASLRVRLLALSFVALVPGFAAIAYIQYRVVASRQAEVHDLASRSAQLAASELERILSGIQSLLIAVSQVADVQEMREPACTAYLANLGPAQTNLAVVDMLDAGGAYRCGSGVPPSDTTFADRGYVQRAMARPHLAVGEYTTGRLRARPTLPVAYAVRDRAGQLIGVLVGWIDLDWLGEELRERGLPSNGSLTLADRTGTIIARQPQFDRFIGTKIPEPFLRLVNATAPGTETVLSQDGTRRVLGYVPTTLPPEGIYVSAGLSMDDSFGGTTRIAWFGAVLAACGGVAMLLTTWAVGSRMFVQPLQEIETVLEKWQNGEQSARTGLHGDDGEIGALGAALDRMMDQIASIQEHRELLSNELLHRVKNTFAAVQAIAGLSLNKAAPARDLLPDFQSRIAALAGTHEVLTRERWQGAELHDLIRHVARPICGDDATGFTLDGPPVDLSARDALGMTMVLHELCTNALKYGALSQPSGRVMLAWTITPGANDRRLELTWRETGGPPVAETRSSGFGSRMIQRALGQAASVVLDFETTGVVCRITVRLAFLNHGGLA